MKCADPVLCYTQLSGKRILRNFSFVKNHTLFLQNSEVISDCGKCDHCRKKDARELAQKCVLHSSLYKENCFLTFTYNERKPGYHNEFHYPDIQKFKKRFRKYVQKNYGKKIEIFNVHEYGANGKKHWHLIVFNFQFEDRRLYTYRNGLPLMVSETLDRLWGHGECKIGDVSEASAMYQAKYAQKDIKNGNTVNKRKSHSKHSGIGKPYFMKHYKQILSLGYIPFGGKKMPIPRYFERLAHKHYCHYYDQSKFYETSLRKAVHRPFWKEYENHCQLVSIYPNREIADLYITYLEHKKKKVQELREEWNDTVKQYLTTKENPDFIKSYENTLHNLRNKQTNEIF